MGEKMMHEYIGVKRITAWPQEKDGKPGYAVKYPDGYVSWSPKEAFEDAYIPVEFKSYADFTSVTGRMTNPPTESSREKFKRALAGTGVDSEHSDIILDVLIHWACLGAPVMEEVDCVYTKDPRGPLNVKELLPDDYSKSKDWRDGDIQERIMWLRGMLEAKTNECDMLWDWFNKPDDEENDTLSTIARRLFESGHIINEFMECIVGRYDSDETLAKLCKDGQVALKNSQDVYCFLGDIMLERALLHDTLEMAAEREAVGTGSEEGRTIKDDLLKNFQELINARARRVGEKWLEDLKDIEGMPYEV